MGERAGLKWSLENGVPLQRDEPEGVCDICHGPSRSLMCASCHRSYEIGAFRDASVHSAMMWAADRAVRMRGNTRRRGSMIAISFTDDELVMLRDRISAGAEVSEEGGWSELLEKIPPAPSTSGGARRKASDDQVEGCDLVLAR